MFSAAPFLLTLLDRAKAIVRRVARPAAERARGAVASAPGAIPPALRGVARAWLSAKLRALSALTRRIDAGETLERPIRSSRVATGADAQAARDCVAPGERPRLPRGFGWMCALEANMREDGASFAVWLGEPWMKAKVLAAPEEMARVVGPILTAMGQHMPDWFQKRSRRADGALPICGAGLWADTAEFEEITDPGLGVCDGGHSVSGNGAVLLAEPGSDGFAPATPPLAPPPRGGGSLGLFDARGLRLELNVPVIRAASPFARAGGALLGACVEDFAVFRKNETMHLRESRAVLVTIC
jgi:hypothetical protein